ncbi:hypothetical protein ACWELB_20985 [Streptomyces asiaticus]
MTTDLRRAIADALTAAAYECDGKCGLSERDCYDARPITFSAMAGGITHVDGAVTSIADVAVNAIQDQFVPPPPGSTEEQLPADILALIDPPPYLSTACETAQLLEQAVAEHPDRQAGLGEWARRMHDRCRINQKFTGRLCTCGHHQEAS